MSSFGVSRQESNHDLVVLRVAVQVRLMFTPYL